MKLHKNSLTVTKEWKQLSFSCSESVVSYMKQMPYKTVQQKVWDVKNWLDKKKNMFLHPAYVQRSRRQFDISHYNT